MAATTNIRHGTLADSPSWVSITAIVQKSPSAIICRAKTGKPIWQSLPCWYLVCENDLMSQPEAEGCGDTRHSIPANLPPLVSPSYGVADLILVALGL